MILVNEDIKSNNYTYNDYNDSFLPNNLKKFPIYEKVLELITLSDESWSDHDFIEFLSDRDSFKKYFVGNALDNEKLYTKDFYNSYPSTIDEIWYESALLNDKEILRDGISYWKFMMEPYLGTNLIQKKLLEKINVQNGTVIEWWETSFKHPETGEEEEIAQNLVNMYSLRMDNYPGDEKLEFLIQASLKVKNTESKLTSVTDLQCPSTLRLNIGKLNKQRLNGNYINYYFDIGLCFTSKNEYVIDATQDFYGNGVVSYSEGYINPVDNGEEPLRQYLHPHVYNGGIALGELNGVSYENVSSRDIFQAKLNYPQVDEYEAFITGAIVTNDLLTIKSTSIFSGTIPGVNLIENFWDYRLWDDTIWEFGSYIETIRDIVDDQTFNFVAGEGLHYKNFGYRDELIKNQTFKGWLGDWVKDDNYYQYVSDQDEFGENGKVRKYNTGAEKSFITTINTEIGVEYVYKFEANVISGTPSIALDGTYMLNSTPTYNNVNITINNVDDRVDFSTGSCELRFIATSTTHTIGVIDINSIFEVDAFSVQEYDGLEIPKSIYTTETMVENVKSYNTNTLISYDFR